MVINRTFTNSMNNFLSTDLVCFSHLRWNFVYQRPQHLLSRFAKHYRVFFIEEPVFNAAKDICDITLNDEKVWVVVPHLKGNYSEAEEVITRQKFLLNSLFIKMQIEHYMFWYYTPMALRISNHFKPQLVIYDCMDELSAFKSAPGSIRELEAQLFNKADVVFTGGQSLYEAKKHCHHNIYPFPSSIDREHFYKARTFKTEPADQKIIPHPRIGFYGVLDERFDIDLVVEVAQRKPDWQMILIGPVVKIDPDSLPKLANLHYLGGKSYNELPSYLAGWDIAMIPFALNESTKYISPTKTPEYLAAGKPVISTSIRDVVNPYGENELVYIADTADQFIKAATFELGNKNKVVWKDKVDNFLSQNSWDRTWYKMLQLINESLSANNIHYKTTKKEKVYV